MAQLYPFQKLCVVHAVSSDRKGLLVASGPELSAIDLKTGRILSQWPVEREEENIDTAEEVSANGHDAERPVKRRRTDGESPVTLSRQQSEASEASVEIVAERKKGERRRPKLENHKLPNISHLTVTGDGCHVVVVTSDDKTVTVLELNDDGQLSVLSQRTLPKRLCAITLTSDQSRILTADKFGDVYGLPLHPSQDWVAKESHGDTQPSYTPSATEYTVHTKGNREALRQQLKLKQFKQKKEGPNFELKLLLGHVSLLTDLAVGEVKVNGRSRPYVITADRDEHIRVSRGIPQTHIIEAYCLGHQEFVSKLCVVPWAPSILIAGNGEPSLRIYEWQTGRLLQVLSIPSLHQSSNDFEGPDGRGVGRMAVSGIWAIHIENVQLTARLQTQGLFLVALEGLPSLLTFRLDQQNQLQFLNSHALTGNILDLTQISTTPEILVSLDVVHKPNSVKEYRTGDSSSEDCLRCFRLDVTEDGMAEPTNIKWEETAMADINISDCRFPIDDSSDESNTKSKDNEKIYSPLGEFLYGLENLRKKRDMVMEEDGLETGEPADDSKL